MGSAKPALRHLPQGQSCRPQLLSGNFGHTQKEYGMDRSQKADSVAALNAVFNEVGVVVVTRNLGLTVAQSTVLRGKIREAGATYKVAKNRLAKIAANGTAYEGIGDFLTGPTALAWSVDPVAAAKVIVDFAKTTDKIEIVGGSLGTMVLDANGVKALASMPSIDELRSKLIGLIQAPATKLAQLSTAPAAKLARVFQAYADKAA
jgi:large subunit ribosomal protein L10